MIRDHRERDDIEVGLKVKIVLKKRPTNWKTYYRRSKKTSYKF